MMHLNALTIKNAIVLLNGRQKFLNAFQRGKFLKEKQGKGLKSILDSVAHVAKVSNCKVCNRKELRILTPKQMLRRLPIAVAQVKAGNTSENLLNEIIQIIYSLFRAKEITKNCITIY